MADPAGRRAALNKTVRVVLWVTVIVAVLIPYPLYHCCRGFTFARDADTIGYCLELSWNGALLVLGPSGRRTLAERKPGGPDLRPIESFCAGRTWISTRCTAFGMRVFNRCSGAFDPSLPRNDDELCGLRMMPGVRSRRARWLPW
jgi:hypothetical protein